MDDSAAAAATWDRLADRYGAQERHELPAIDAALALAAPQPTERLVDLATGTGLLLRRLAAAAVRPREAIGLDHSTGMLARVGELPAGWSTLTADARAVPLPDGCADVVTCAYLLQLLEPADRAAVLAEARRLLAPGARSRLVVVTTWADRRLTRAALDRLARARPQTAGGMRPLDPATDLARAGFETTQRVVLARGRYPSIVLAAQAP
jgi:2-polyprenyl-6-hydroxyphenyl methylase/3-demethylubiquinone-9 3-methyltransferase